MGCGIGTALCGFLIDLFGAVNAFRSCAIGTAVLLVLFVVSQAVYYCVKKTGKENREQFDS